MLRYILILLYYPPKNKKILDSYLFSNLISKSLFNLYISFIFNINSIILSFLNSYYSLYSYYFIYFTKELKKSKNIIRIINNISIITI